MTRVTIFAAVVLALCNPAGAFDEKTEAAKEALASAIRAEDQARAKPGSSSSGRSGAAYIRSLEQAFRQQSRRELEYPLGQIAENYRSPEVAAAIKNLQDALDAREEQLENSRLAELEALVAEATRILKDAEKPADLDVLLEKMNRESGRSSEQRGERIAAAFQKMMLTRRFLTQWQDYLQARQTGNLVRAVEILRSFASSENSMPIPRSRLIALIDADAGPSAAKASEPSEIMELDDIAPALRKIRLATGANGYPSVRWVEMENLTKALTHIDGLYQSHKAGLPVNLTAVTGSGEAMGYANSETAARLKAKLLLLILPRVAGAPETTAAKPGEDATALIGRIILEAGERGDLSACIRALEARQALDPLAKPNATGVTTWASCRAGISQEAAGQHALAVTAYQNTLENGCDPVLARLIGKRLDAIRQAHPEAFKNAMESLKPPQN